MLAHLLRTNLLTEAWIAPKDVRDVRALLRHRISLVRTGTSLQSRIRAVLADAGIREDVGSLWTRDGRAWLASLDLPAARRAIVDDCLAVIDALNEPIKRLRSETGLADVDPRVDALTKLYGIGPLTAMLLVAEIGDIARFPSARKLCAWAGLTPSVRNSDRTVRHGHITKQGSPTFAGRWWKRRTWPSDGRLLSLLRRDRTSSRAQNRHCCRCAQAARARVPCPEGG